MVGHALFESLRNDHIVIGKGDQRPAIQFLGTYVEKDAKTVPPPSSKISMLNMKEKPKTFIKGVLLSDLIVIDLVSNPAFEEAEAILKLVRNPPDGAET